MTEGPSLVGLDAPNIDWAALRSRTGATKPVDPPSLWSQLSTSAKSAAGLDEIHEAARQKAVDDGYADITSRLDQIGISGSYSWRLPLPGAQPFYNEDEIWRGIAEARKRDPKAFADAGKDASAFRQLRTSPVDAADAERQRTLKQSGWAPWIAGQFYGGLSDPINQAGMFVGAGGARTIAQAALRDAGINVAIEAAQAPSRAIERAGRGVETTPGGVASELAIAAGTGAVFGAGLKALEQPAARAFGTAGDLARRMRETIGWDRMTDAEQAAVRSLERESEIVASSPFRPGKDTDQYVAKVQALADAAQSPEPPASRLDQLVPLSTAPRARPVSSAEAAARRAADPWDQVKVKIARAENATGDPNARNPNSSATGLYQVIDSTWMRVARDFPEAKGLSENALLGMRSHPAWQERVMDRLGVEYRAALSRIGAPEDPGNLYLMHFAGTGGASKILRAAGDTPIEELLSKAAIKANPFLRGKSADEVIDWAHARVGGGRGSAPVLRRDIFPDDEGGDLAWREAQSQAEAADREWADFQRDDSFPRRADGVADDDIPFDLDDPRARSPRDIAEDPAISPIDDVAPSRWSTALADLRAGKISEASGVLAHPALDAPIDVKWGTAGDPARNFKGGYGLAHILAKHPEMEAELDRLPQLIADMEVMRNDPRRERLELQSPTHEASIALTWHGKTQHWLVTAYEKATPGQPLSARRLGDGENVSTRPGATGDIGEPSSAGNATPDMERYWAQSAADGRKLEPLYAVRSAEGSEPVWWSASRAQADRMAREETGHLTVERIDPPDEISPATRAEVLRAFDDPAGAGATHQIDSLEHDLRMWLADDEAAGLTVRLNEEGDVISAADALHELDQDEAAIAAARACMAPGGPQQGE